MRTRLIVGVIVTGLLPLGCGGPLTADASPPEAGQHDADEGADPPHPDGSEETDPDDDGGGEILGGPLTLVVHEAALTADRLRDLDGDGNDDNAIADLGVPSSTLFAAALSEVLQRSIDERGNRVILHFAFVDDLSAPGTTDSTLVVAGAVDTDVPPNWSDDFDGAEPFFIDADYLDSCGEPRHYFQSSRLEGGELRAERGSIPVRLSSETVELEQAEVQGRVEPWGASVEVDVTGYVTIGNLGGPCGITEECSLGDEATSMLEVFLRGGAPFGVPTIPGLTPDLDMDGDGLERMILDTEGHIAECRDGDGSSTAGRDCWQDPGMADGFALTMHMKGISAQLVGRQPGWEYRVPGNCDEGLPETSLLDVGEPELGVCGGLDEQCDPRSSSPCCDPSHRCSGAEGWTYRCLAPCAPSPCDYGGRLGCCRPTDHGGLCQPIVPLAHHTECMPGTTGCATEHGVTEGTLCAYYRDGTACFESCAAMPSGCPETALLCAPLVFEEGGSCANEYEPDGWR